MVQKIKKYLGTHQKQYELIRYVIAGGLTTLLSMAVFAVFCMAVSPDHTVDGATKGQALWGNVVSWIIAVLFAFWINRRMVFQVRGGERLAILKELGQFALSRLVSFAVFEMGLMALLLNVRTSNSISKLIVLIFVMVFNYVVSKFWIFAKKQPAAQESTTKEGQEADPPPPKAGREP